MGRCDLAIQDRAFYFCSSTEDWDIDDRFSTCERCSMFRVAPCAHAHRYHWHDYRVVFTDGACLRNGYSNAVCGTGVALGERGNDQLAEFVGDDNGPRTNQRAELLAALKGLRMLQSSARRLECHEMPKWVLATDSEYVVKGITTWYPRWRDNDWRGSNGRHPANLDLFHKLDAAVDDIENSMRRDDVVGFVHIPRCYNGLADQLSKEGAASGW